MPTANGMRRTPVGAAPGVVVLPACGGEPGPTPDVTDVVATAEVA